MRACNRLNDNAVQTFSKLNDCVNEHGCHNKNVLSNQFSISFPIMRACNRNTALPSLPTPVEPSVVAVSVRLFVF